MGAAVAYTVGYFMLSLGPDAWRWMLASSAMPALLILTMRLGTPESPRWLLSKGRAEEAEAVLKQMLGPDATLADIEEPEDSPKGYMTIFRPTTGAGRSSSRCSGRASWCRSMRSPPMSRRFCDQFGLAEGNTAYLGAVIIQIFYVVGSLSGALFVNRGRRKLLLWSFAISALPLLGLAVVADPPMWLVLVLFCVFGIAMYSGQCLEAIYPPSCSRQECAPPPTDSPPAQAESVRRSVSTARRTCSTTRCS